MEFLYPFFPLAAGFFICYAIPHLCSGLQGNPFRNPFGQTQPRVNFLLGSLSLFIGLLLLAEVKFNFDINIYALCFWIGFLLTGFWLARRRHT